MTIYGLVDCNNFYVSCERVFNPKLEGRPTIVLSSNDGCAIARSAEAKELGVKMAQPLFQIADLVKRHDIQVLSGNFHLYNDMSSRVAQVLADTAPSIQKYSIDECFLDITGMDEDLTEFGRMVQAKVVKWTGIPVGVGIAETKTLAKLANRIAKESKKSGGVVNLVDSPWRDKALEMTEVGEVWGIGKQFTKKLNRNGVQTALDLTNKPDVWIRREMSVGGLKTVRELRGEDCIGFENIPKPKQTTLVSRSFGHEVSDLDSLTNAITVFATTAAEDIRKSNLVSSTVSVFIETNRFSNEPQYSPTRSVDLSPATNNTKHIVHAAVQGLKGIHRDGFEYKKAGVMLLDLVDADHSPLSLFDQLDPKDDDLIKAFDQINRQQGPGSINFGNAGLPSKWRSNSAYQSPRYTTEWNGILVVKT
ncbi:MAG: Y-family DNA polymerase [Rhodospirillaceae bacterium]|jgi:DNA polymerase V|nr:Y-family DNA polymerase [Rhodospirillaceae bacterium]MBT5240345.1 Y-family DNA polymerase [Rhodospirillaceae bacterium]MBT7768904.1 Y-family DNA polymerase [Rhodospirillales bacterium]